MASNGLPTAPAQFDPHSVYGKPPGGGGSLSCAAPCSAAWSSALAMAKRGGRPRAVRSRLVATNSWRSGDSSVQFVGRVSGVRPSCARPLAITANTEFVHGADPSYCAPEQLWRKSGCGEMLVAG